MITVQIFDLLHFAARQGPLISHFQLCQREGCTCAWIDMPTEVQQPSDVAAQTLPASLEEILDAPVELAFPLSNAPVTSARTPLAPFPMPSDTIANSPPLNYGHSMNGTHNTISHHSAILTTSSSLPKSTNAMSKKMNVFVLMPQIGRAHV